MLTIATAIKELYAAYKEAMARREVYLRTRKELDALNTRELNDIGIHPGDIHFIASRAAREAVI